MTTDLVVGVLVLLGALAIGYRFGLPVAGSLWRRYRLARRRQRLMRQIARALDLPPAVLRMRTKTGWPLS